MKNDTLVFVPKDFFTIYRLTYVMLLLHDNASIIQRANMSHFVAYILQFQEIIVYKIPPGGGGRGSLASLRSNYLDTFNISN